MFNDFSTLLGSPVRTLLSKKYRHIMAAIGLFILLDASILGFNYYISHALNNDTVRINLSGQLNTMSQRLVKSLYEVRDTRLSAEDNERHLEELRETYQVFTEVFTAFSEGGTILDSNGNVVSLEAVDSAEGKIALQRIKNIWYPFQNLISPIMGSSTGLTGSEYSQSLQDTIKFARANNKTMLEQINILSASFESIATSKASRLRIVQVVGITLAIINFITILVHFIGKLRENDDALRDARHQTSEILETVNEGLFLIDQNLVISSEHSNNMKIFFGIDNISELTLNGLLESMVTQRTQETASEYIQLIFDPNVKEKLVKDLNPLEKIETHTFDNKGRYVIRYLSFSFNRVMRNEKIVHILVTVNDITTIVELEKEIESLRLKENDQDDMLMELLPVSKRNLELFINTSLKATENMNDILREDSKSSEEHRNKIESLFRETHKIKGEASVLSLKHIQSNVHQLEDVLNKLRNTDELQGDDFLSFTVKMHSLIEKIEAINYFKTQTHDKHNNTSSSNLINLNDNPVVDEIISCAELESLSQPIAKDQNKSVNILCSGLSIQSISNEHKIMLRESIIQLVRNSITHGIESLDDRLNSGKNATGKITVALFELPAGGYEILVKDDGAGIDTDKLRQQAMALGKWENSAIQQWSNKQLMSLIFRSGLSTNDKTDINSGRGVGMSILKNHIKNNNGNVKISSKTGKYTRFEISLHPKNAVLKSSAA